MNFDYQFNSSATRGATWFMVKGDEVAALNVPVFPPSGTIVSLPDGRLARVTGTRLDLSNETGLAMVYVSVEPDQGINEESPKRYGLLT